MSTDKCQQTNTKDIGGQSATPGPDVQLETLRASGLCPSRVQLLVVVDVMMIVVNDGDDDLV